VVCSKTTADQNAEEGAQKDAGFLAGVVGEITLAFTKMEGRAKELHLPQYLKIYVRFSPFSCILTVDLCHLVVILMELHNFKFCNMLITMPNQVTHFQVIGSFTMYSVDWPPFLTWTSPVFEGTSKLDMFSMPGLACVFNEISFENRISLFAFGPLVVILLFGLPVIAAYAKGLKAQEEIQHLNRRWSRTLDIFWSNTSECCILLIPLLPLLCFFAVT